MGAAHRATRCTMATMLQLPGSFNEGCFRRGDCREKLRVLPGLAGRTGHSPHVIALALELFRGVPPTMATQAQIAAHLDLSTRRVKELVAEGQHRRELSRIVLQERDAVAIHLA
jgi:hypothetical protein